VARYRQDDNGFISGRASANSIRMNESMYRLISPSLGLYFWKYRVTHGQTITQMKHFFILLEQWFQLQKYYSALKNIQKNHPNVILF
jgi:hypothetical protein